MGIKIDEIIIEEKKEQKESFIETKYIGNKPELVGTKGEAFYDVSSGWFYRTEESKGQEGFQPVETEEIDCIDSGWVKGEYTGSRNLTKTGKARWNEEKEAWDYKPKGFPRVLTIAEGEFVISRDKDY